jgi:GNAT superfamily N-acetyltransferase
MNITLIAAEEEDRTFFRHAHHLAYRPVIEEMFGWNETKQDGYADKDFDERKPHIIHKEGRQVGVVGWQIKPDHIWFGPIFILPEYQGQGIGTHVVKEFIKKAKVEKLPLRLQTLLLNEKAKAFYERLGFRTLDKSAVHWQLEHTWDPKTAKQ